MCGNDSSILTASDDDGTSRAVPFLVLVRCATRACRSPLSQVRPTISTARMPASIAKISTRCRGGQIIARDQGQTVQFIICRTPVAMRWLFGPPNVRHGVDRNHAPFTPGLCQDRTQKHHLATHRSGCHHLQPPIPPVCRVSRPIWIYAIASRRIISIRTCSHFAPRFPMLTSRA